MPDSAGRIINDLKGPTRQFLIEHASGPQPIVRGWLDLPRSSLLRRDLIRYEWENGVAANKFPKATALTEIGREVVCTILGQAADQIISCRQFLTKQIANPKIGTSREVSLAKLMADAVA